MVIRHVKGQVKSLFGLKDGTYTILTVHQVHGHRWTLRVENTKGRWREIDLETEQLADQCADEVCREIDAGDYCF
ncbi:hypothetical protein FD16_GL000335 [Paucilactobacillus suebicus DSM 5007 = KCTC 3549]|uniref:Uncharacterized protein n=2 Tax=Paucilactobacillus suebicus TaxID=152335 RepID=A0A0R1W386_9LACO|nr:hypothetical protein FD16_GL000335 [Paucilactobacillus suebicus DSM 5007 = KCTC 3549]